jgi:hypothetical protein
MDVSWQDSVASFLYSSGSDLSSFASFVSGDGATLWSSPADSGLFSGQSMLWESSADTPGDKHLGGLSSDSVGPDTSTWLAGGWMDGGTWGVGSGGSTLDSGLLWAGAGDTSSSLGGSSSATGLGSLGALDLGAGNAASQWQQFVADFAGSSTIWLNDAPQHLLWTGVSGQPPLATPSAGDSLHLAGAFAGPSFAALTPEHLVWTDPSQGLPAVISDPTGIGAAPPTLASGAGAGALEQTMIGVPISGAGARF